MNYYPGLPDLIDKACTKLYNNCCGAVFRRICGSGDYILVLLNMGSAMKKICLEIMLCVVFLAVAFSVCGCQGLGRTPGERADDLARQSRLNGQMLIDDIDAIFQTDRASRLSEYTVR